jgi:hypothetical protein
LGRRDRTLSRDHLNVPGDKAYHQAVLNFFEAAT